MRINDKQFIANTDKNDSTSGAKKAGKSSVAAGKISSSSANASDTVSLSSRARDVADIAAQLKEASEVREELVNELREKIKNGTYQVSGRDIAGKIAAQARDNIF